MVMVMTRNAALACLLAALPALAEAQETPGRLMLEAGIDGGNDIACPGHYVGIQGRVAGPVSAYGQRGQLPLCGRGGNDDPRRRGATARTPGLAAAARPARRDGVRRRRHRPHGRRQPDPGPALGARFIVDRQPLAGGGGALVLFQIGGYVSF